MNIDKQDERLLHEILSKYKQGLISGLIQGNNVTFTSTGCRNKVISSTGGGTSSLFPKGYAFISESRDFLPTDEGKLLVLAAGVTITMPSEFPFLANQIVGVNALDSNCYYQDKAGSTVQIFGINNQPNEVVVLLSEPDFNSLLPISSSVIEGKTMLKYLYDKSQNAIPLSGTEVGSPVTGDIQFEDNKQLFQGNDDTTKVSVKFKNGELELTSKDNINNQFSKVATNVIGTTITANDGTSESFLKTTPTGILLSSDYPTSKGLTGEQDFTANVTDLDYTQKIYVDKVSGFKGTFSEPSAVAQTTYTVTIPTQADANYSVFIEAINVLSSAIRYVTNKTTTTFDVVYVSALTGSVEFDYFIKP